MKQLREKKGGDRYGERRDRRSLLSSKEGKLVFALRRAFLSPYIATVRSDGNEKSSPRSGSGGLCRARSREERNFQGWFRGTRSIGDSATSWSRYHNWLPLFLQGTRVDERITTKITGVPNDAFLVAPSLQLNYHIVMKQRTRIPASGFAPLRRDLENYRSSLIDSLDVITREGTREKRKHRGLEWDSISLY